jgi:TPR repeat protein
MEAREQLQKYEDKMSPMDEYFVRSELAAMGYPPAQFEIAYLDGSRSEYDAALMKKASDQGFTDAQAVMADWYFDGSGVVADPKEANRLYALAAAQGNHHAQFHLYEFALKQKRYRQAFYWVRICAEEGPHPSLIVDDDCPHENAELEKKLNTKQRDGVKHEVSEFLEQNHLSTK